MSYELSVLLDITEVQTHITYKQVFKEDRIFQQQTFILQIIFPPKFFIPSIQVLIPLSKT